MLVFPIVLHLPLARVCRVSAECPQPSSTPRWNVAQLAIVTSFLSCGGQGVFRWRLLGKCPGPQPTSAAGGVKDSGFVRGSESSESGSQGIRMFTFTPCCHRATSDPTSFHAHQQRTRGFLLPHCRRRFKLPALKGL